MKPARKTSLLAGVFFLMTEVTSIAGLALYGPVLHNPAYIVSATGRDSMVLLGAFFEVLLVVAMIGTAAVLFPVVRRQNERIARAYRAVRYFEAAVIVVGIISIVSIVALRQHAGLATGKSLLWLHDATFLIGPGFAIGLDSALLAYLMYTSQLIPRAIAVLGMAGGSLVFASSSAILAGLYDQTSTGALGLALPVFAWEVSFAIWMIAKGFKTPPDAHPDNTRAARLSLRAA